MSDALRSSLTLNVGASNGHEGHKEPTNSCAAISNKVVKSSKLLTSPQLLPLLPPGQQVSNVTTVIPTSNAKKGASSPSTAFEFLTFKWLFKRRSGQGVTNSSSTLNVGRNRRSGQANISRATTNVSIANGQSSGPLPRIKKLSTATCLNALLEPAKKCTKGSEEASTRSPMKASYSFDDIDRLLQSTPVHREKNRRDKKKERVNKYKSNVDLANFRTFDKYQVRSFRDDVSLEEYEEDDDELDEGRSMVTPSLRRNCKLCLGQRPISNFHTIWSCGCSFCRPCLSTYLTYAVRENMNVPHIECPDSDCPRSKRPLAADVLTASGRKASTTAIRRHVLTALGQHKSSSSSNLVGDRNLDNVFSAQEVQLLVDEITFELFKKLKVEYEVDRDPCRVWCPKANCDTICVVTKPTVTCVTDTNPRARTRTASDPLRMSGWPVYCSRCDKTFCNDCRKPWHSGFPCSEPTEDDLLMLLQREGSLPNGETGPEIKRCPRCSVWIERDEGCAQMMCRKCKHVFCWFCLQSLEVFSTVLSLIHVLK